MAVEPAKSVRYVVITNKFSGKSLGIIGDDAGPKKDGTFNGVRINQSPQRDEVDHRWVLIRS